MVEVSFEGIEKSYRCFTCGGVFLYDRTSNGLPGTAVKKWTSIVANKEIMKHGDNCCPRDGTKLLLGIGEEVPVELGARKCEMCKWWWFPLDTLSKYKPKKSVTIRRTGPWAMAGAIASITLPLMFLTVLVGAMMTRQQFTTSAGAGVSNYTATYMGGGQESISFTSYSQISQIVIRKNDGTWTDLPVNRKGNLYSLGIGGLQEGINYEIIIAGKIFKFQTKL